MTISKFDWISEQVLFLLFHSIWQKLIFDYLSNLVIVQLKTKYVIRLYYRLCQNMVFGRRFPTHDNFTFFLFYLTLCDTFDYLRDWFFADLSVHPARTVVWVWDAFLMRFGRSLFSDLINCCYYFAGHRLRNRGSTRSRKARSASFQNTQCYVGNGSIHF